MIVLNELEYAENCLKGGQATAKPCSTLPVLARYYFHHRQQDKEQITKNLTMFMAQTYPEYHSKRLYWDNVIEKLVKNVDKYKLHEIEGVWITKNELRTIQNIKNQVLERLAFVMLCLAKLAIQKNPKNTGWVNDDVKDIFRLARISGSVASRYMKIGELYDLHLLDLPKRGGLLSYKVMFIDDSSKNELFVHDFRELGYEYLKYQGQNFIRCAECGILVPGNKNGTKRFCANCIAYTPMKTKTIHCIDCGIVFEVSAKNNRSCRCVNCQRQHGLQKAKLIK